MAETQPRSPPPSWSVIPLDLASLVLRLLPAYADRARFAAVCPQWRNVAQQFLRLHPPLPLLALPDGTFYSLPYAKPFRFPGFGFAGYQGVCGSWLVFPRDDGCFLHDPFARATVRLPPLSRVRLRPPNAVQKWTKWEDGERSPDPYTTWMHIEDMEGKLRMSKIILCSPNLVAALVGVGRPCHLPICHPGGASQILMCQPGASSWSVRAYDKCKLYEDMAFYQGKLYAIANDENLFVVNISQHQCTGDPQVSRVGQVIKGDPWQTVASEDDNTPGKKLYLVESRGPTLFGIDHPTLSAVNESAWFVVLSRTVELWRGGDGRQGPPRQASFNTSFTMDGTSPVAFVVLLDRFPTYKGKFISVTTFISGPGDPTQRGSNRFAAVKVGTVKSYAPESPRVGLNVTVTPSSATPTVTVICGFHGCCAAAVGFYYNSRYRRWKKDLEQLAKSMQRLPGMPCRIDFSDIKKATKNFDGTMKLGSGTFGSVYRCRLPAALETGRPEMEVAVKKFTRNDDRRFDDFLEEVSVINRLRHKNIVPLIGT
ncbi:uncharacterized protein LOC119277082 [Triticum dicoccoides]|uniref:uncharacterized protein LOC119277082 n=1 Tax=Triticum dicoccoides TaxID=85692 RepID=UPI00188DE4D8|nr:uncharacterized protein LOC119277082 [Triticum dicoccoides]